MTPRSQVQHTQRIKLGSVAKYLDSLLIVITDDQYDFCKSACHGGYLRISILFQIHT